MVGLLSWFILAALFAVSVVIQIAALKLGVHWVRAERATYVRATAATILIILGGTASLAGDFLISSVFRSQPQIGAAASLVVGLIAAVLIPLGVITLLFRVSPVRAFLAWLWPLFASLGVLFAALLFVRPLLLEAFQSPTNAMVPTLRGRHHRSVCPECNATCYCSVRTKTVYRDPYQMICEKFHTSEHDTVPNTIYDSDRFLVAKFAKPKRWDLLVFRFPQDPKTLYVMRLVGLPGETVTIEDGAVHANNERLPLPPGLQGQTYLNPDLRHGFETWGTASRPAKLDAGEYFVLGDFSASSYDSRMWIEGARGHNAYAVPASHIVGIVSTIYWPPERWRNFR